MPTFAEEKAGGRAYVEEALEESGQDVLGVAPRTRAPGWQTRYQRVLVASDVTMALLGAASVGFLRWRANYPELNGMPPIALAALIAGLWAFILHLRGAYDRTALGFGVVEFRRVLNSGVHLLALLAILAYGSDSPLSRVFLFGSTAMIVLLTVLGRYALRRYVHRERAHGRAMHHVLVVGTTESVERLAAHFSRAPEAGYSITAACVPEAETGRTFVADTVPVLGPPTAIIDVLNRTDVDVVAVADTAVLNNNDLRHLAWDLTGSDIELVVAPAITDLAGPRVSVSPVAGLPLLHVDEPRFNRSTRYLKGCLERVLAFAALALLSPILLVIAVLVKLTSPGPVLFKQERVGKNGTPFRMWKFRTMVVDAEKHLAALQNSNESTGLLFKMKNDPRVTSVGRVLRRTSLDELPQLVHVVTGTMALVGPRPPLPSEVANYDSVVERRLLVRPGLTGLWQVNGRSDLPWEEAVRLDLYYVDNWSVSLDISILLKTVSAVIRGSGAY